MGSQKGFGAIAIIFMVLGVIVVGSAGAGAAALLGQAPQCQSQAAGVRSDKEIGDALEKGSITITDGEATTLAQNYIGGQVEDGKICFTKGLAHFSGKKNLGSITPSFYVTAGVDLTGSVPNATNLSIQFGSLPNNPILSSLAQGVINKLIADDLSKIELKQQYKASFTDGSVTISK
ncbi:MAG: hypothetical protein COX79_05260 [Candidatus Levybacteria bacterium CG_4_10_14_0_2_um_filter_36_16]|nr:MAG: hypothetical protein AUK12_03680 [Candidatus Levybacteria bacterium CG2_30_37_29]PIZ96418.1 MAG: hypothetical protein COX79_05260 [Candidatus Levybacteria bacterium CG_4_10_14_0_2_um_filter_36_16]PJA90761.1 MAG: hypothetical protein CO136_00760 [Candidatus Levybacteria bacterium CG_4_9_14_3_um_filter_36_7]